MEYNTLLGAQSLTKKYGDFIALDNVSFDFNNPCIIGLIGNNGAGKTTLLKILAGHINADSGKATAFDMSVNDINANANIILIDDSMTFPHHYKLSDVLNEMLQYFEFWDEDKAHKLMQHFNLPYNKAYNKLSKGMKNIFNTIIGLAANSAITLMDEPTTGMDASARKDFYSLILNEFMVNPRMIVLSSHMIGEMEQILSHAVIVKSGKIIFSGEVNELTDNAYLISGLESDLEPLLNNAQIFNKTISFGKAQYSIMAEFGEKEMAYMQSHNISHESLGLNETCIGLCNEEKTNISDIYN